jgi:hypothetical protein
MKIAALADVKAHLSAIYQQPPATQLPLPSNSSVRPLIAR